MIEGNTKTRWFIFKTFCKLGTSLKWSTLIRNDSVIRITGSGTRQVLYWRMNWRVMCFAGSHVRSLLWVTMEEAHLVSFHRLVIKPGLLSNFIITADPYRFCFSWKAFFISVRQRPSAACPHPCRNRHKLVFLQLYCLLPTKKLWCVML